jgi:hypothetical protein
LWVSETMTLRWQTEKVAINQVLSRVQAF